MVKTRLALLAGLLAASCGFCADDLLLEAEVEPAQVHVHEQAVYRLRFYQAIDVRDLHISAPGAQLADLRPIGAGHVYDTKRDGIRYRVHERSYAIFPFASGSLELGGARATGMINDSTHTRDLRHPVELKVAPLRLAVLPAIAGEDHWLPAKTLTLTETWNSAGNGIERRTIRIEAHGIDAAQLPELQVTATNATVYAEPSRFKNHFEGEVNIGVREQTFRIVASRAGEVTVPEIRVPWWNIDTGKPAAATLPARSMHAELQAGTAGPESAVVQAVRPHRISRWLALAALLCVITAAAWSKREQARAAWRLRRACASCDARAVRDALLAYGAWIWRNNPPATLASLAERLDERAARKAAQELERRLYGPPQEACDARMLRDITRCVKRAMRLAPQPQRGGKFTALRWMRGHLR